MKTLIVLFAVSILAAPGGALGTQAVGAEAPIGILLAAGDISTCGDKQWHQRANHTAEIIRGVIAEAESGTPPIPVKVLALGDLAYGKGRPEEFECFASRWSGFEDYMLPVPGNHEYQTDSAAPYFDFFSDNPFVTQNGDNKGYFTLNFPSATGPWQLIGLNAHIRGNGAMADQLTWLGETLSGTGDALVPCVLAFWHAPTFSSGRHGHDYESAPDAPLGDERPMQEALRQLYEHGASVVLAGHDHNYEQFMRHDSDGKPATDGIRSFVVGTGGSLLTQDGYEEIWPISEGGPFGKTRGTQGVLELKLYPERFEWTFLGIDGSTLQLESTEDTCVARKTS